MFEEFAGLPMHPLVIHAAVVFLPLTVLTSVVFAVVPRWRWVLRRPLLAGALICVGATFAAKQSGEALLAQRGNPPYVAEHQEAGSLLFWFVLVFAALVVAAVFLLGGRTRIAGGKDHRGAAPPLQIAVAVLLVVAAVGTGYQAVVTGDAGARATWGGG